MTTEGHGHQDNTTANPPLRGVLGRGMSQRRNSVQQDLKKVTNSLVRLGILRCCAGSLGTAIIPTTWRSRCSLFVIILHYAPCYRRHKCAHYTAPIMPLSHPSLSHTLAVLFLCTVKHHSTTPAKLKTPRLSKISPSAGGTSFIDSK